MMGAYAILPKGLSHDPMAGLHNGCFDEVNLELTRDVIKYLHREAK